MKNTNRIPKFEIGELVEVNWAGGHITRQVISGIKDTHHGFWYSWNDAYNDFGSGAHEKYLNKCTTRTTREEYAEITNGHTSVSFEKIITVLPDNEHPYELKYSEIDQLLKYPRLNATMPQGYYDKRIKQLQNLGYTIERILWQGEEKHHPTRVLLTL